MAEVTKVKYLREFQRNLFSNNEFWTKGRSDSGADSHSSIEIPNSAAAVGSTFGAVQNGQANGANAAALTPTVRLNNKQTYAVETFGTEPVALQLSDLDVISYNKRAELYREHQEVIAQDVSNYAAVNWGQETANTDFVIPTTGSDTRTSIVTAGYAGLVKRISKADVIEVKRLALRMNLGSMPGSWYGLITPEQWEDLLLIPEFVDYDKSGRESKLKEGIVGKLLGIEFLMPRHNEALNANVLYNASYAKTAYGAATNNTMTSAAIFYHSGLVRYAKGKGMLYEDKKNPIYKSDIMSADCRFGASKSRTDGRGVISLVEDQTA